MDTVLNLEIRAVVVRYLILSIFSFLLIVNGSISLASTLIGKVISIQDGDTITILSPEKIQTKIRLYGIDCPEKSQDFGNRAKKFTASLVARKTVKVIPYDIDKYGRTVGVVFVASENVNEEILKAGLAWQYRKYCLESFCSEWLSYEAEAKNNKLGLWRDVSAIAPWDWRKGVTSIQQFAKGGGAYHGNQRSHVFHCSSCRHFNCKNCVVEFDRREEAVAAGYRPCGMCRP